MDEIDDSTDKTAVEDLSVGHQLGKYLVGSIAAFGANKLSDHVYDKVLRAYRARKS